MEVQLNFIKRDSRTNSALNRQGAWQVTVKDNGEGIPQSNLPHLFDRFYRVDPARHHKSSHSDSSGSGLGLAIAQAIAENHRGQIEVTSVEHQEDDLYRNLALVII